MPMCECANVKIHPNGHRSTVNGHRSTVNGHRSTVNGQRSTVIPACRQAGVICYFAAYPVIDFRDNWF